MKPSSITAILTLLICGVLSIATALPRLVSAELPMYPERARMARVAGTVKLSFEINSTGAVQNAEVVSGNPLLRDAALVNVRSWRFDSSGLRTSSTRYETEFIYKLGVQDKPGEPRLTVSMQDFRHVEVSSEFYVQPIP